MNKERVLFRFNETYFYYDNSKKRKKLHPTFLRDICLWQLLQFTCTKFLFVVGDQGTQILQTKKLAFRVCDVRWVVCSHCPHADICKSSNKNFHNSNTNSTYNNEHIPLYEKKYFIHIYTIKLFFLFECVQLFTYPISLLFGFKLLFHHHWKVCS